MPETSNGARTIRSLVRQLKCLSIFTKVFMSMQHQMQD
jgi:hypothetical protein